MVSLPTGALGLSPEQGLQEKELHRPGPLGGSMGLFPQGCSPHRGRGPLAPPNADTAHQLSGPAGTVSSLIPKLKKRYYYFLNGKVKYSLFFKKDRTHEEEIKKSPLSPFSQTFLVETYFTHEYAHLVEGIFFL